MKIFIPNNYLPERKYIINTLLKFFLGVDYIIELYNKPDYEIILDNNKKIIIKDAFWSKFKNKNTYLDKKNIPEKVFFAKNDFLPEKNIPIIFGKDNLIIEKDKIICGIDIFASCFFMLSRWEEKVIKQKDKHYRFLCNLSLAQKNNFHLRPVVNEYLVFFQNILIYLGYNKPFKKQKFNIIPTHDVDFLYRYDNFLKGIKIAGGDILKRYDFKLALKTIKETVKSKQNKIKDPYDTFDFLMDVSEKNNLKSEFYFIAGKKSETDVRYNFLTDKTKKIINNIRRRGHIIGIHGGYSSFNNNNQLKTEIERFKSFGIEVKSGRQHFLRFENPLTWQIWERNKLKFDSTIGYTNSGGFRAGTCFEYPVFDIENRKQLNLIERPLIFMETVSRKKYPHKNNFINHFYYLKNITKKYKGNFVFLWHNSNFNTYLWKDFNNFYTKIFND